MEVQHSSKQKVMSTLRNNSKDGAPVSLVEFEDFHEDATEQTQVVLNDNNSEETQKNMESTSDVEDMWRESASHKKLKETAKKRETNCSKKSNSVMPVIPKRGCMNNPQYDLIMTKLKELRRKGNFVGHEQMVKKLMAKFRRAADLDMKVSIQIERAVALYFQNNLKDAKKELKLVVKQEQQLKNPGILVGRALNLLTAIYNREKQFRKAMKYVEWATTRLKSQDSTDDIAELYHSHGALIAAMLAAKEPDTTQLDTARAPREKVYELYKVAVDTGNHKFKEYVHVKMAALLLESRSKAERSATFLSKEDVLKAKEHLDFDEGKSLSLGTEIKFLLLRSDQYLCEGKVAMAMVKAQEANELIQRRGFQLEFVAAKTRIEYLSAMLKQEKKGR